MALVLLLGMQLSFRIAITTLLFFLCVPLYSQEESLENILENLQNEANITLVMEDLERIINFPINLKKSTSQELLELPTIDLKLAEKIVESFKRNPFISLQKLKLDLKLSNIQFQILNLATINSIKEETKQSNSSKVSNNFRYYSRMSFDNLNSINTSDKFQGKAYDNTNKLFLSLNSINTQIGIATKKDYYEPNNFDNISGFVNVKMSDYSLYMGNFQISSANGLVFGRGMSANKGATDNDLIINNSTKVNSYSGTSDYIPFRGIAASFGGQSKTSTFGLLAFASSKNVTYSLDSNSNGRTLQKSGLYRDSAEIIRKYNTSITEFGASAEIGLSDVLLGVNYINSLYSRFLNIENKLLNLTSNVSIFLRDNSNQPSFLFEIARDVNSNYAINGTYKIDYQSGNILGFARYYGQNYRAMYSRAFGEYSNNQDEIGLYLANEYATEKLSLYTYIDVFAKSKSDLELPIKKQGYELFQSVKTNYRNKINAKLVLRFKKQNDYLKDNSIYKADDSEKFQSKIEFETKSIEKLNIKFWIAFNRFNTQNSESKGTEIGFDLKYRPFENTLIGARYSHFSVDSFDAAIWSYEQIYPNYGFSPVLTGYGNRNQIYINQKVGENLRLWFRYLDYNSLKYSSEEFEQVANNKFNLQLDINF